MFDIDKLHERIEISEADYVTTTLDDTELGKAGIKTAELLSSINSKIDKSEKTSRNRFIITCIIASIAALAAISSVLITLLR